jgi:hypothetical protein
MARAVARLILPRHRYCLLGFCAKRDTRSVITEKSPYGFLVYAGDTRDMPLFGYPPILHSPSPLPLDREGRAATYWHIANAAALLKISYGAAASVLIFHTSTAVKEPGKGIAIDLDRLPKNRAERFRVLTAVRIVQLASAVEAQRIYGLDGAYGLFINSAPPEMTIGEAEVKLGTGDMSIKEIFYIDAQWLIYAGVMSYAHAAAVNTA